MIRRAFTTALIGSLLAIVGLIGCSASSPQPAQVAERPVAAQVAPPVSEAVQRPDLGGELDRTLDRIRNGGPFPYTQDGSVFRNAEQLLPRGNYREYTVRTPFSPDRGARRLVVNQDTGDIYYTDDHYESFRRIEEGAR